MAGESKALKIFAALTAAMVVVLLLAGGLVTTTKTGDTIPTWPHWRGKIHGGTWVEWSHRAIAGVVGFMVLGLAVAARNARSARLARIAFWGVAAQALLGGLRIFTDLPAWQALKAPVAIVHATFAQVVFCAVVAVALLQSKAWSLRGTGEARGVGIAATSACFLQLVAGAVARHTGLGFEVHVLGAVAVLVFASILASKLLMTPLRRGAWILTGLLAFQILLGVFTWMFTQKDGFVRSTQVPLSTLAIVSLHVATGAGLLAACLGLTLLSGPSKAADLRAVAA
jgi:heme A synthase